MISEHIIKTGSKEVNIDNNNYMFYWDIVTVPDSFHNCAYVYIPINILQNKLDKLRNTYINVHGSITYNEDINIDEDYVYKKNNQNYVIIGWDYIHANDYHSVLNPEGEKHSLEEIQEECVNCIDQIVTILSN